jgi:hypothetical protein
MRDAHGAQALVLAPARGAQDLGTSPAAELHGQIDLPKTLKLPAIVLKTYRRATFLIDMYMGVHVGSADCA